MDTLELIEYKRIPKLPMPFIKREVDAEEFLRILREKPEIIQSTEIDLPKLGSNNFGRIFITIKTS